LKAVCLKALCLSVSVVETGFKESHLFEIDLLTGLEPGSPGGRDAPLYGRRDARRYESRIRARGWGRRVGVRPRRRGSSW
jgi:hypothetical protein